jgi:hypothetical protein
MHSFDVDGGFGDAIHNVEVVGCVDTEDEAKEYVNKWSKPEPYDFPYAMLWHKKLYYREVVKLDISIDPFGDCDNAFGVYNYDNFENKEDK